MSYPLFKRPKENVRGRNSELSFFYFRERVCHFSLRSWTIRPSEFFGARRKIVLRGEGNVWTPVSWSFDKLHEVGVLSYLSYTLFKCFVDDCVGLRP